MSEFYVGQKVVCVDATPAKHVTNETMPVTNGIYTIRGIVPFEQHLSLLLVEIVNPIGNYREGGKEIVAEPVFHSGRFRPLESKSIEVFRKIARDVTEGKKVRIGA